MDTTFYLIAIPAVLLVGLSKGGMGDVLGLMGVPILSFVIDPVRAAAILLPILVGMDLMSLWLWRHERDWKTYFIMMPGALVGIAFGWATAAIMPSYVMRLVIGIVALAFSLRYFYLRYGVTDPVDAPPRPHNKIAASFWSSISGYGSFVAHAGGAPYQVYALPLKLPPKIYVGTAVRFFASLNALKLIPYFAMGQLDTANLFVSAMLFPVAPVATVVGALIVKRMKPDVFYPYMYGMCALAGLKLTYDGLAPLLSGLF